MKELRAVRSAWFLLDQKDGEKNTSHSLGLPSSGQQLGASYLLLLALLPREGVGSAWLSLLWV